MSIADNLKKQRGDMSQSELARQTGVSQKTISAIEKGRIKFPTYQTAKKFAEALNCSPSLFLGVVEDGFTTEAPKPKKKKQSDKLLALKSKLGGK
jgi:transcriptional regulator with XRE-family HTH domain